MWLLYPNRYCYGALENTPRICDVSAKGLYEHILCSIKLNFFTSLTICHSVNLMNSLHKNHLRTSIIDIP